MKYRAEKKRRDIEELISRKNKDKRLTSRKQQGLDNKVVTAREFNKADPIVGNVEQRFVDGGQLI